MYYSSINEFPLPKMRESIQNFWQMASKACHSVCEKTKKIAGCVFRRQASNDPISNQAIAPRIARLKNAVVPGTLLSMAVENIYEMCGSMVGGPIGQWAGGHLGKMFMAEVIARIDTLAMGLIAAGGVVITLNALPKDKCAALNNGLIKVVSGFSALAGVYYAVQEQLASSFGEAGEAGGKWIGELVGLILGGYLAIKYVGSEEKLIDWNRWYEAYPLKCFRCMFASEYLFPKVENLIFGFIYNQTTQSLVYNIIDLTAAMNKAYQNKLLDHTLPNRPPAKELIPLAKNLSQELEPSKQAMVLHMLKEENGEWATGCSEQLIFRVSEYTEILSRNSHYEALQREYFNLRLRLKSASGAEGFEIEDEIGKVTAKIRKEVENSLIASGALDEKTIQKCIYEKDMMGMNRNYPSIKEKKSIKEFSRQILDRTLQFLNSHEENFLGFVLTTRESLNAYEEFVQLHLPYVFLFASKKGIDLIGFGGDEKKMKQFYSLLGNFAFSHYKSHMPWVLNSRIGKVVQETLHSQITHAKLIPVR